MTTIIFKSEKKAKEYRITAAIDKGVYLKGGFIRNVKTDDINECTNEGEIATEIVKD